MHTYYQMFYFCNIATQQHVTYSCTCPFRPHSLHTAVEHHSTDHLRTDINVYTATMTTATVGKDRPADNSAVVHLHTVRGDESRKHVKRNTGITIKGNALGVAAIQRPEQTPRCFN